MWLKVILFDFLAQTFEIMMENHFTESGKANFSALSLLVYFIESLYGISRDSLLSEKLFG